MSDIRRWRRKTYPHQSGDVTVIGPGCFASEDRSVLNWEGENYVPQDQYQGAVGQRDALAQAVGDFLAGTYENDGQYARLREALDRVRGR